MGELGDRVADDAIDISRQLARLNMRNRNPKVNSRNRYHELLTTVACEKDNVRFYSLQARGQLKKEGTEGLRHGRPRISLVRHVDAISDLESVPLDLADAHSELLQ